MGQNPESQEPVVRSLENKKGYCDGWCNCLNLIVTGKEQGKGYQNLLEQAYNQLMRLMMDVEREDALQKGGEN